MLPREVLKIRSSSILRGANRPFAVSGHMVQKTSCWRANCALGHRKQRKFKLSCFVFDVRGATLVSSKVFFVPLQ